MSTRLRMLSGNGKTFNRVDALVSCYPGPGYHASRRGSGPDADRDPPHRRPLGRLGGWVRPPSPNEAERLGVHSICCPEAWGFDAVAPLAFIATRTSRTRLGS